VEQLRRTLEIRFCKLSMSRYRYLDCRLFPRCAWREMLLIAAAAGWQQLQGHVAAVKCLIKQMTFSWTLLWFLCGKEHFARTDDVIFGERSIWDQPLHAEGGLVPQHEKQSMCRNCAKSVPSPFFSAFRPFPSFLAEWMGSRVESDGAG
jgi:hypothetical protein